MKSYASLIAAFGITAISSSDCFSHIMIDDDPTVESSPSFVKLSKVKENGLNSSCSNNKSCHAGGPDGEPMDQFSIVTETGKQNGVNSGCSGNKSCHAAGFEGEPMDDTQETKNED